MEVVKANEINCGMAELKGIFKLILSSMRLAFMTFKMNFNSPIISRQFSTVSFLIFF